MAVETAKEARPAWYGTIGRLGIAAIILMAILRAWIWLSGDARTLSHWLDSLLVIALVCYVRLGSKRVRICAGLVLLIYMLALGAYMIWLVVGPVPPNSGEIGSADRWAEFHSREGNFAVSFPHAPEDKVMNDRNGTTTKEVSVLGNDGVLYAVVYSFGPEHEVSESDFEVLKNGVYSGGLGKCTSDFERPALPAVEGYIGRSYKARCILEGVGLTTRFNEYLGKQHYILVQVSWRTANPEPVGAARFLMSFHVFEPAK
jgi:hypothetical protein